MALPFHVFGESVSGVPVVVTLGRAPLETHCVFHSCGQMTRGHLKFTIRQLAEEPTLLDTAESELGTLVQLATLLLPRWHQLSHFVMRGYPLGVRHDIQ